MIAPAIFSAASILNAGIAPKRVTLYVNGREMSVVTERHSVASVLSELRIPVKKGDDLYPSVESPVKDEQVILLTKKSEKIAVKPNFNPDITYNFEEKQVSVPFKSVQQPSKWVARGRMRKVSKGQSGITLVRYKVTLVKGKEIKREIVNQKVLVPTKNEVVLLGSGRAVYSSRVKARSYSYAKAPLGGQSIGMTATGYWKWVTGSGITASGRRAGYGVVAVDPRVIPLGTKLYVPGYGYAIAADTGGAIKGNKIDLCFETYSEAKRYGRRKLTVQVVK